MKYLHVQLHALSGRLTTHSLVIVSPVNTTHSMGVDAIQVVPFCQTHASQVLYSHEVFLNYTQININMTVSI